MSRRGAYAIVAGACALPRLAVLLHERASVLDNFEKSKQLALTYLHTGTFGYVPGEPSAYTQPLYGWFLIPVFWIAGVHWWSVGTAQVLVAVASSILVFEIGRRCFSTRTGILAAVIATLQPYLVWHDIHGNREILDQLLGAAMFLLVLVAAKHRTLAACAVLGLVAGVAILSNTRLVVLPLILGAFLLWRGVRRAAVVAVPVLAAVALAPWVVRNRLDVGCWAITTDARGLWKANNANTYATLAAGLWIDQVVEKADIPQREVRPIPHRWLTPEEAGGLYASTGAVIAIPECAQTAAYEHLVFQFWEHHPGAKAKLALQATRMMWDPRVGIEGAQESGVDSLRRWVEPLYAVPVYLLAIAGLFFVPPAFRVLALSFAAYETVAAWVFAGTTRYRVPWDFVLALLAAVALERLWSRVRASRVNPA
jgi:4-amino-4-deoxy-L-arabinose transferase-like glycosyltransferase